MDNFEREYQFRRLLDERFNRTPEELASDLAEMAELKRQIKEGELVRVVRCVECANRDNPPISLNHCLGWGTVKDPGGYCHRGEKGGNQ